MIDGLHGDCIASILRYLISLLYSMGSASSIDERVSESGCSCQWVGDLTQTAYVIEFMLHLVPHYANAWGFLSKVMENAPSKNFDTCSYVESVLMT